jgi:hypothetical protein
MRNLKKTLCLVLALVFVLGLCTVGAVNGTDFDDQSNIQYKTAVKAMSGLGILKGDDNDGDGNFSFRPTDKVTRAEAAKIIAYIVVGEEVEKWPARQAFDDVPATHWAAKYVTYCQYNNIIAGYGNGKFGPDDPVTQAQLAKMLLSCCGYGAKGEFVGEGWDQNVAKVAFQTKVLKGILSTDWDGPSTREETALLGYNTMMEVRQVVLSKDTNDYAPAYINGSNNLNQGWTLSETTWDLTPVKAIVTNNKASDAAAKGSTVEFLSSTTGTLTGAALTIITEDDENADILGHEVTLMYREEGVAPNITYVAYYIDDECKEVSGAEANTADMADATCNIDNGVVTTGVFGGSAKNYRIYDANGTYVLNGAGKVVGYKTSSFFVAPLAIDPLTGITSVADNTVAPTATREVKAPKDAKAGDLMTVYQCGSVYTAEACTKQEKVAISQGQLKEIKNKFGVLVGYYFSYNNGTILPSDADNLGAIVLTSVNAYPIDTYGTAPVPAIGDELRVGYTYTLYFDAEGGCIGYSDEVETASAAVVDYVCFVSYYGPVKNAYNENAYYVQVVKSDGTEANYSVATTTAPAGIANGDICKIAKDYTNPGKYTITKVTDANVAAARVDYDPSDPTYDFSNATFIGIGNNLTGSALTIDLKNKPAVSVGTYGDPASWISVSYKLVKNGTKSIKKVDTVWYNKKAAVDPNVADSYIYVVSTDVKEKKLIDNVSVDFWNGYKDGEVMDDLRLKASDTPTLGFFKYSKNATTGIYTLTPVDFGGGTATGARTFELKDGDTNGQGFIMDNKLYVKNSAGSYKAIDLTNVKIVRIANNADSAAAKQLVINSAAGIQSALQNKANPYTVTISFLEVVNPATGAHSAGGGVIYVTAVK